MNQKLNKSSFLLFFIFISSEIFSNETYHIGKRNNPLYLILFIIVGAAIIISSSIIALMISYKRKKAKKRIAEFERYDNTWNQELIKSRIETIFFKLQQAITERDLTIVKNYLTERMLKKQTELIQDLINKKKINKLESIKLIEANIISVTDFKDDNKDILSCHINGKMINYLVDEKTKKIISGDSLHYKPFEELWHFRKQGNNWLLDDIDSTVNIYNLIDNYTEE